MDDQLALGGEAAHEERVEAADGVPVEAAEVVAGDVGPVRLELDASGLGAPGKAAVAGAVAHAAADAQREALQGLEVEAHARARRAEASTPSTTWAASTPAASAR